MAQHRQGSKWLHSVLKGERSYNSGSSLIPEMCHYKYKMVGNLQSTKKFVKWAEEYEVARRSSDHITDYSTWNTMEYGRRGHWYLLKDNKYKPRLANEDV